MLCVTRTHLPSFQSVPSGLSFCGLLLPCTLFLPVAVETPWFKVSPEVTYAKKSHTFVSVAWLKHSSVHCGYTVSVWNYYYTFQSCGGGRKTWGCPHRPAWNCPSDALLGGRVAVRLPRAAQEEATGTTSSVFLASPSGAQTERYSWHNAAPITFIVSILVLCRWEARDQLAQRFLSLLQIPAFKTKS